MRISTSPLKKHQEKCIDVVTVYTKIIWGKLFGSQMKNKNEIIVLRRTCAKRKLNELCDRKLERERQYESERERKRKIV